jgi:hypothetical protein
MIILYCIKEGSKLRIKFHSFINQENQRFTNVYNNRYNCMFPKDIRAVGRYYKVPDADIRLASKGGSSHYYSIKRTNIVIMTDEEKQQLLTPPASTFLRPTVKIFDAEECVICLSVSTSITFMPCGHRCVCATCNVTLKQNGYKCPVCREKITQDIIE